MDRKYKVKLKRIMITEIEVKANSLKQAKKRAANQTLYEFDCMAWKTFSVKSVNAIRKEAPNEQVS